MTESAYAAPDEDFGGIADDDDFGSDLPGRPRRKFLNQWSALLLALVVGAVGFYVGIRVEKSDVSSSGTSATSAVASKFADAGTKTGKATTGATSTKGTTGFASRLGDFAGAAGAGTTGTVSSIDGDTLYVKETSGNTVKVKLSGTTTITKTESVSKSKVNPGDTVDIDGVTGSNGVVTATSVTDSGDSSTSTASTAGASTTGTAASSVISSLFAGR